MYYLHPLIFCLIIQSVIIQSQKLLAVAYDACPACNFNLDHFKNSTHMNALVTLSHLIPHHHHS